MIYIENNSLDPYFNFALEYYFLKESNLGDVFLLWRTEPTLMIGKHQNTIEEINQDYADKKSINIVRRISGGGTIYTDPNGWQFSFIIKSKPLSEIDFKSYIDPIIQALAGIGVNAYYNSRNDILIDGKKFSGNAQYSDETCSLHHGSILFDTDLEELVKSITISEEKIISKGIRSVRERVTNVLDHLERKIDTLEFKRYMLNYFGKYFSGTYELTSDDRQRIKKIADEKFRNWDWNYGISPKFNISKSTRYQGGKIEFDLDVNKGYIERCKIFGDFFSVGDVETVKKCLEGCPYKKEDVRDALQSVNAAKYFYLIEEDELLNTII